MPVRDALIPEFDQEMSSTRKTLQRVPTDKFAWKPHVKSMSMGHLASHLANLPSWVGHTLQKDSLDMAPVNGQKVETLQATSQEDLLNMFDKNITDARKILAATADEEMFRNWSLQAGGHTLFTMPKIQVLRSFVFSHTIHHRAQLGVYLRLNDIAVPSVYGPSADEQM